MLLLRRIITIDRWRVLHYLAAAGIVCGSLNCGYLAIPPAPHRLQQSKIFGIGLSRTGTTSLTVALNQAKFPAYHALPHILKWSLHNVSAPPTLNKWWADAYVGHTDIQASVVFKELAIMYPTAKFVYNRRPPEKWGDSMFQFMQNHSDLWYSLQSGGGTIKVTLKLRTAPKTTQYLKSHLVFLAWHVPFFMQYIQLIIGERLYLQLTGCFAACMETTGGAILPETGSPSTTSTITKSEPSSKDSKMQVEQQKEPRVHNC